VYEEIKPEMDAEQTWARKKHFKNLPLWARTDRIPLAALLMSAALVVPLAAGAVGVHVAPFTPLAELSRDMLTWSVHYGAALLTFLGGIHFGLSLGDLAVPKETTFRGVYNLARYGWPVIPLVMGMLASVMAYAMPRDSIYYLITGFFCIISIDSLFYFFCLMPPWFITLRIALCLAIQIALGIMATSEQVQYFGRRTQLKM